MKKPLLTAFFGAICIVAFSQQLSLIKDINPGTGGSNVSYLTQINDQLFFAANNGVNGMELWKSDGTEAGTVLIKDINAGAGSSSIGYLVNVNGVLFFVANNGANGVELWKSDGTEAGTVMVKDIRAGSMGSNPSGLVNVNGTLYFAANDGVNGTELWKSDGSSSGTVMIRDINPLSSSSYPKSIAALNGEIYFSADNGINGPELWKSDGTSAGTVMIKDIWPGSNGGYPFYLVNTGSTLFFTASNGSNGIELWKSDGTSSGTVMVKDIWPGIGDSNPFGLKTINGTLFFSADNGINGSELWKSDGTSSGTVMLKDVWPGAESGAVGNFSELVNQLFFTGNDGVNGYKTWQSDGSASGTEIATMIADPANATIQELAETYSHIFASVIQPETGKELWGINYSSILPLKLIEFKARLVVNDAALNWKTEHEINTSDFSIERSFDANNFVTIGSVATANSAGTHQYYFSDPGVTKFDLNKVYYRLKMINTDGKFVYSEVVAITIDKVTPRILIYPNPVNDKLTIEMPTASHDDIHIKVLDASGRVVSNKIWEVADGENQLTINTGTLPKGIYFVHLIGIDMDKTFRIVKQ